MPQPQQGDGGYNAAGPFIVAAFCLAIPFIIWVLWRHWFTYAAEWLVYQELRVIPLDFWDYRVVARFLNIVNSADPLTGKSPQVTGAQIWALFSIAARPLLPVTLIAFYVWARRYSRDNGIEHYKRVLDLEGLIAEQSISWPTILPIRYDDPLKDRSGRWDTADSPEAWLTRHGIAYAGENGGVSLADAGTMLSGHGLKPRVLEMAYNPLDGEVDPPLSEVEEKINKALPGVLSPESFSAPGDGERLAMLIGTTWKIVCALRPQIEESGVWAGPFALPWHQRALFAAFVLHGSQLREEGLDILQSLSRLWVEKVVVLYPKMTRKKILGLPIGKAKIVWVNDDPKLEPSPSELKALKAFRRGSPEWLKEKAAQRARRQVIIREKLNKAIENDRVLRRKIENVLTGEAKAVLIDPSARTTREAMDRLSEIGGLLAEASAVADRHAFIITAMLSVYEFAKRGGGVRAASEFIWLRACDRSLWYALNSQGRRVPHVEAAGAFAHWRAEQAFGKPLPEPYLAEAVTGFYDYFNGKEKRG